MFSKHKKKEKWHKIKSVGRIVNQYIIFSIWIKSAILVYRLFKKDRKEKTQHKHHKKH